MHSLVYYETHTPSYDAHWGANAQALGDLHAERVPIRRRLRRLHLGILWPQRDQGAREIAALVNPCS